MQWSNANYTPLRVDKCGVLHCNEQPNHNVYYIKGAVFKSIDNFKDLGVIRFAATNHVATIRLIINTLSQKPLKFQGQSGVYFGQGLKNYSGRQAKYM